jgi:hypothetical protein
MKKMKFVSIAAAMFAACVMLSSCWGTDEPVQPGTKTDVSGLDAGEVSYSITVYTNVASKITVGTTTKTITDAEGGMAEFENLTDVSYTVKAEVTASGSYLPSKLETVDVKFTEEKTAAVVNFNFVDATSQSAELVTLPSTGIVATTISVENDYLAGVTDTKEEVPVLLTIPADTKITDANGDPLTGDQEFSIVAYVPAAEQSTELKEEEKTKALVVECKPDGAQFTDGDVTLRAYIGTDAAGAKVEVNGQEYTVNYDGYVEFDVPHFSSHTVYLKTTSTSSTVEETLVNQTIDLKAGENTFTYTRTTGWETEFNYGWFFTWQSIQFGKYKSTEEVEATFDASADGKGTILITQNIKKYVIKSGSVTMNTTVYGDVTVKVTPEGGQSESSTSGHGGGSGN